MAMQSSDDFVTGDQAPAKPVLAFGPFRLFPQQRRLLRDGTPLNVSGRVWEILLALVERAGEIVTNRQLLARVWPGIVVEQGAIRVHIAGLRKMLGEGKNNGMRYVETVTGQGYRFIAPVTTLSEEPAASAAQHGVDQPRYNAPVAPLRILGREQILAGLATSLLTKSLVTVVGPGGVGKTTVAMEAACRAPTDFFQGVCMVDLGSIVAPALAPASIASALGLTNVPPDPIPSIVSFLRLRRMLLVLDSCEHVVEAIATAVEHLLAHVPGLRILATSREPLRISRESVVSLPPLAIPSPGAILTADDAMAYSALHLFVQRAMESQATFELRDNDVAVIADICRKLDGLPLAIELAAARVDVFGLRLLAENLDDRLKLLTKGHRTALPRHQTLRATIDWSYETLSLVEQTALRRLAVFAGSFDVESACEVIVGDVINAADVLDLITDLVAKSLLKSNVVHGSVHFYLLQTARAYAMEKLESSNESNSIRRRHAELCCAWGAAALDWKPEDTQACVENSNRQIHDIRAALEWCFSATGDVSLGVNLTVASGTIWFQLSFLDEYREYLNARCSFCSRRPRLNPRWNCSSMRRWDRRWCWEAVCVLGSRPFFARRSRLPSSSALRCSTGMLIGAYGWTASSPAIITQPWYWRRSSAPRHA
jgi:predicted ATPase